MCTLPLILIGSISTILLNIQIPIIHDILDKIFKNYWRDVFIFLNNGTFDILSIITLIAISYSILSDLSESNNTDMSYSVAITVVIGCYFAFIRKSNIIYPTTAAANTGLFISIIFSVLITNIYYWLYNHRISKINLYYYDALSRVVNAFEPALLTYISIAIIKCLYLLLPISKLNLDIFVSFLSRINEFFATFIFEIITSLLWFLGMHGNNILGKVFIDVFGTRSIVNANLFNLGQMPSEIFTSQFLNVFIYIGGTGTTLSLILALLLKGSKSNSFRLAKLSIIPGLFNVNEIILLALPVILNPFFLIPFIITPIVLTSITFFAMYMDLVPYTINTNVPWTTPIIFAGYMATGSIRGSILQIINLLIGTAIYYPFVCLYESFRNKINNNIFKNLVSEVLNGASNNKTRLMDRRDDIGVLARGLASDIQSAINSKNKLIHIEFQPQVSYHNKVKSIEALLRCNHEFYGYIPPPVIIQIAEEARLTDELGYKILELSLRSFAAIKIYGIDNITLSINLTAEQINNENLVDKISEEIKKAGLKFEEIEFELTENTAFERNPNNTKVLSDLKNLGCSLAIDDFGMGHSSLMYIKDFNVDKVKLDKVLVTDILTDPSVQEIVSSIANLCNILNLDLIAEYVETEEQKEKLHSLGCDIYQGFYYSKSLKIYDCVKYINKYNNDKKDHV